MQSATATELLRRWRAGDTSARDQVFEQLYADLRLTAGRLLRNDSVAAELRPTELVNESAMRLFRVEDIDWKDRAHFLALSAQVMRRTLIDHARQMRAAKREAPRVTLLIAENEPIDEPFEIETLHDALERLAQVSPQHAQIIEMRFFAGMNNEQIADVLGISTRTAKRHWRSARAWLREALEEAKA